MHVLLMEMFSETFCESSSSQDILHVIRAFSGKRIMACEILIEASSMCKVTSSALTSCSLIRKEASVTGNGATQLITRPAGKSSGQIEVPSIRGMASVFENSSFAFQNNDAFTSAESAMRKLLANEKHRTSILKKEQ